jgi:hypothetical protein
MLRKKHPTLLVCLALAVSVLLTGAAWADQSQDPTQENIQTAQLRAPVSSQITPPKAITKVKRAPVLGACPYPVAPIGLTKVKPAYGMPYVGATQPIDCVLPRPAVGQWEMSAGVIFARLRGKVAWPRYPWWGGGWGGWGWTDGTDFTDGLQLPGHLAVPTWSVKYQFRPTWAMRYSGLAFEANGGGQPSGPIFFGPWQQFSYGFGQGIQSKYRHDYHRVGLLYDALNTCRSSVKIFADWVHANDRIEVGACPGCFGATVFSKGTDAAIAGVEFQKCVKTTANGGAFSWDCKAGAIFLDDVEGWDVQAGAQYAIPLNCGRAGYLKGGYRLVELKKSQNDYLLNNAVEGGFMEMGFIF